MRSWTMAMAMAGLLLGGCAPSLPRPMTAAQTIGYDSGPALVAYLIQPDASPIICDLRAHGPHVSRMTAELRTSLVNGLVDGTIAPVPWSRCVDVLLKGLPPEELPPLYAEVGSAYLKLLDDSELENGAPLTQRLATLHRLYLDRRGGADGRPAARDVPFEDLRTTLTKGKLGPVAAGFGRELLATLDVEAGQWQGHVVDVAMMDALAASGTEMTLSRFAERLPSVLLRDQARRRILRIHIALSPFAEVRDGAAAVEDLVVREGHNRIALSEHPLLGASFSAPGPLLRYVAVRQDVWARTATLLGGAEGRTELSVLPELSFRGILSMRVQAISHPVGLCEHKRELDPSPCIAVADVSLENPFAYLDKGGAFHFRDEVALTEVIPLARRDAFVLPVKVGGQTAETVRWGLTYQRPADLAFNGNAAGVTGPRLSVRVERITPSRFVFTTQDPQGTHSAVVEAMNLRAFHVISRGGEGYTGTTGFAGSTGHGGSECSDGGPGGAGGPGGDGGPGGKGGDIVVTVACGGLPCLDTVALLRQVILSVGGPGGSGGAGGAGGYGGSGGPGRASTTHVDQDNNVIANDPGCMSGSNGSSGASGLSGTSGPAGAPGAVTFAVVP